MKSVIFTQQARVVHALYNPGERAAFPAAEADALVSAGLAKRAGETLAKAALNAITERKKEVK